MELLSSKKIRHETGDEVTDERIIQEILNRPIGENIHYRNSERRNRNAYKNHVRAASNIQ